MLHFLPHCVLLLLARFHSIKYPNYNTFFHVIIASLQKKPLSLLGIFILGSCNFTNFYLPPSSHSFSPLIFVIWHCDLFTCVLVFLLKEDLLNHWGGGKSCRSSWWAVIKPGPHPALRVCKWQPFSWRPESHSLLSQDCWALGDWGREDEEVAPPKQKLLFLLTTKFVLYLLQN